MPRKKKRGRAISRHSRSGNQKKGAGWSVGVDVKAAEVRCTSARTVEPPMVDEAAPIDEQAPHARPTRKPSKAAVRKRKRRDEQPPGHGKRKVDGAASTCPKLSCRRVARRHRSARRSGPAFKVLSDADRDATMEELKRRCGGLVGRVGRLVELEKRVRRVHIVGLPLPSPLRRRRPSCVGGTHQRGGYRPA